MAFPVIRDVSGLGMGLYLLATQATAQHPDAGLIVAGLTLVSSIAGIYGHAVLSGPSGTQHGGQSSPPPSLPPSSSPPSPSGGAREQQH